MKKKSFPGFELRPRVNEASVFIEPFEFEELSTKDGYLMPDVFLLRRAESMAQLYGVSTAKEFLDKVNQAFGRPEGELTKLRRHMSDEQIFMYIKRRNIQTPGELENWIHYLDAEEVLHSVKKDEPSVVEPVPVPAATAAGTGEGSV